MRAEAGIAAAVQLVTCLAAAADAATFRVVDEAGRPLEHAVVTAAPYAGGAGREPGRPEIQQVDQQFLPRVTVLERGTRVHFPNRDVTQHHVYSFSPAKTFELELYEGEDVDPVPFDKAGIVALGCNIHDWMLGYVFVTEDPLYGVTPADGRVTLAGTLGDLETVTVWQPAARETAPRVVPGEALATGPDGTVRLVVPVDSPDPLFFERDPLQDLFSEPGE